MSDIDKSHDVAIGKVFNEEGAPVIFKLTYRESKKQKRCVFFANIYFKGSWMKGDQVFALASADRGLFDECVDLYETMISDRDERNKHLVGMTTRATQPTTTTTSATKVRRRGQIVSSWVASKGDEVSISVACDGLTPEEREGSWFIREIETDEDGSWAVLARSKSGKVPGSAPILPTTALAAC